MRGVGIRDENRKVKARHGCVFCWENENGVLLGGTMRKEGDLQVWWIPQVPMKPFEVDVRSVEEGVKIMEVLAKYDKFQFDNRVKPDYCNAGGLGVWEDGEWHDWYDEETGEDDPAKWLESNRAGGNER